MRSNLRMHSKIRALGQHTLLSQETAERVVEAADLSNGEAVLEIGTGNGIITKLLSAQALKVTSWEIDSTLFKLSSQTLSKYTNIELRYGDAFSTGNAGNFDVCVTSLPYSQSLRFIKWLSLNAIAFNRCVAIVQSEFADKLASPAGSDSYRAVSVIAQKSFKIDRLFSIPRFDFSPPPKVLSEAIRLSPRKDLPQPFFTERRMHLLNRLFAFRSKLLSAALKHVYTSQALPENLLKRRVERLSPDDFERIILNLEDLKSEGADLHLQ